MPYRPPVQTPLRTAIAAAERAHAEALARDAASAPIDSIAAAWLRAEQIATASRRQPLLSRIVARRGF